MDNSSELTQPRNTDQKSNLVITTSSSEIPPHNNSSVATFASHSLVGLAGKLFSILTELKKSQQAHAPDQLQPYLNNELQQFSQAATKQGHTEETIVIAQFALARSLDEVIAQHGWGQTPAWQTKRLVDLLPHAQTLTANFVDALQKMSEVPEIFVDVLELIYLCQNLTDTHKQREALNQELYTIISQQRGEFERRLSKKKAPSNSTTITKRFSKTQFASLAIGIIVLLVTLYISFNYLLDQSSSELQTQLNSQTTVSQSHNQ